MRTCPCPHAYPVCACVEGVTGEQLIERSFVLSSIAGWPGPVSRDEAARILREYGRHEQPAWLLQPRVVPRISNGPCNTCGGRA